MAAAEKNEMIAALSIAGSDSGGAAGIQIDLLTFTACGVYGTTAITAATAQNHTGVSAVHAVPPKAVRAQIDQVLAYYPVRAIKVGMLHNAGVVEAVAEALAANPKIPAVVDPVMISSSGAMLLEPAAVELLRRRLLPAATVVTPNFDEAAVLLGGRPEATAEAMERAAVAMARDLTVPVLLKGGHFAMNPVLDVLAGPEGIRLRLKSPRVADINTHGSGCTLSAAIAAYLALGNGLVDAVEKGHVFLQRRFSKPLVLNGKSMLGREVYGGER